MASFDYSLDEAVEDIRNGETSSAAFNRIKWDIGPGTATLVKKRVEEGEYAEAADYVQERR